MQCLHHSPRHMKGHWTCLTYFHLTWLLFLVDDDVMYCWLWAVYMVADCVELYAQRDTAE